MKIVSSRLRPLTARTVGAAVVCVAAGACLTAAASPASTAARAGTSWDQAGAWRLNESQGAAAAKDSSGNELDARIGRKVQTGLTGGKRTYVRFPKTGLRRAPDTGRLLLVDESRLLDPRRSRFRVDVALRTRADDANVVQKGQANTAGGFWKLEITNGRAVCLFRSGRGVQAGVGSVRRIDDGRWHRIVCTRYTHRAAMHVDGQVTDVRHKSSGKIANARPLSIGGKPHCGNSVDCDFFVGGVDYVRISR